VAAEVLGVRDRARFARPAAPAATIERPQLDQLYATGRGKIVRVLGPGGYGKSTLVARWVSTEDRPVLWFDAEPIDNDPAVFADALVGALARVDPDAFVAVPSAPPGSPGFADHVIPAIGAAVATCREPFVMVVDDLHLIDSPETAAVLDTVAAHLPPHSTLVLSGRAHHLDEAIPRFRLEPGVVDVDVAALAFDDHESRELLLSMGVDAGYVGTIPIGQFEGWPAGLRLAGLVLKSRSTPDDIESIAQAAFITDYLRAEWTRSLQARDLQFLREAACLRTFTAEMCSDVLGLVGTAATLRRLQHDVQLVVPLDRRDRWYRMHPILAEWLESELRDDAPERWVEVHTSAAQWWELRGDIDLALDHAVAVGDIDRCEQMITDNAAINFPMGAHSTVRRWLQRLPEERIVHSASLSALATMAAIHVGDGDRARQWNVNLANLVGNASEDRDVDDEVSMIAESLRATLEVQSTSSQLESARRACDHLPTGVWRVNSVWVMGTSLFMAGDDSCIDVWEQGALDADFLGAPLLVAHNLSGSTMARDLCGDSAGALERGRRVQAIIRAADATLLPTNAIDVAISAYVEARTGHHEVAAEEIAIAARHLEGFRSVAPWINTMARLILVRTTLMIDDRAASRRFLREAEQFAMQPGDAHGALRHIGSLRRQVEATSSISIDGAGALTPAERRVLAYLPTNLGLSDIAAELFVSRNTVKSHAAAIYRKLGTSSRREAVELARRAGLIDGNGSEPPH
jgi:LuxR family maltose regulon positive regulatory protein